jgi:hypothetical protein
MKRGFQKPDRERLSAPIVTTTLEKLQGFLVNVLQCTDKSFNNRNATAAHATLNDGSQRLIDEA